MKLMRLARVLVKRCVIVPVHRAFVLLRGPRPNTLDSVVERLPPPRGRLLYPLPSTAEAMHIFWTRSRVQSAWPASLARPSTSTSYAFFHLQEYAWSLAHGLRLASRTRAQHLHKARQAKRGGNARRRKKQHNKNKNLGVSVAEPNPGSS